VEDDPPATTVPPSPKSPRSRANGQSVLLLLDGWASSMVS